MQPEEHAALEEFGARFSGVKFYKGMPLAFTTSGHGKLTTRIDEHEVIAGDCSLQNAAQSMLGCMPQGMTQAPDSVCVVAVGHLQPCIL